MLFRLLLIVALIYFLGRFFRRLFTPGSQYNSDFQQNDKHREGETTIKFNKKGEKIVDKNKGEYVDFEEVD